MTTGEDYPPPRHRRPLSEPPTPGREESTESVEMLDQTASEPQAAPWFDEEFDDQSIAQIPPTDYEPTLAHPAQPPIPEFEPHMGRPRMPGSHLLSGQHHPADPPPANPAAAAGQHQPANPATATGQHQLVDPGAAAGQHQLAGPARGSGQPGQVGAGGVPTPNPDKPGAFDNMRRGPLPMAGAVIALLAAAGLIGWMFNGSGSDQEVTIGGSHADSLQNDSTGDTPADLPPLSPAVLPAANEEGLVGLELALIDPYTGTGSTGSVELYLNSITGQVCHIFDVASLAGRYRAYIHEAAYPQAGPIVVDLGEVANAVPRCVNASPIDLARALSSSDGFYVAAHGPDRSVVLRAQLADATMAFDNRDPDLLASQEAARVAADAAGDGEDDLFGTDGEGAYLIVDAGRVSFEGPVPDEATAELLRSAFIALSGMGVEVVDNLMVEAGAPPPSGRVIVADALLFDSGEDQISSDSPVLDTIADLMVVNPGWTMTITGHTDNVGDYLLNSELSLRRANNVRNRLADLEVPAERIRVQGAGPEQPIDSNDTPEGRARNRRIEISIHS